MVWKDVERRQLWRQLSMLHRLMRRQLLGEAQGVAGCLGGYQLGDQTNWGL